MHPGTTQTTKMYSHKWIVNNTYLLTIEPRLRLWILSTAQKWSFYEGFLLSTWPNPQETADSVTFTEKILQEKFHFLRSDHNFIEQILFQYISCLKLFTPHKNISLENFLRMFPVQTHSFIWFIYSSLLENWIGLILILTLSISLNKKKYYCIKINNN